MLGLELIVARGGNIKKGTVPLNRVGCRPGDPRGGKKLIC